MTELVWNNKSDFIKHIHRNHHKTLYLYALKLCKRFKQLEDVADDLTQDLYLRLMEKWPAIQFKYAELGLPYLNKMMKNIFIDRYRKERSHENMKQTLSLYQEQSYELEELEQQEKMTATLSDYIKVLSDKEYTVLQYRIVEELSYEQIAFRMNIPTSTVGTHLRRAKQKVKATMGSHKSDIP